jgi:hypothetical protein
MPTDKASHYSKRGECQAERMRKPPIQAKAQSACGRIYDLRYFPIGSAITMMIGPAFDSGQVTETEKAVSFGVRRAASCVSNAGAARGPEEEILASGLVLHCRAKSAGSLYPPATLPED